MSRGRIERENTNFASRDLKPLSGRTETGTSTWERCVKKVKCADRAAARKCVGAADETALICFLFQRASFSLFDTDYHTVT